MQPETLYLEPAYIFLIGGWFISVYSLAISKLWKGDQMVYNKFLYHSPIYLLTRTTRNSQPYKHTNFENYITKFSQIFEQHSVEFELPSSKKFRASRDLFSRFPWPFVTGLILLNYICMCSKVRSTWYIISIRYMLFFFLLHIDFASMWTLH